MKLNPFKPFSKNAWYQAILGEGTLEQQIAAMHAASTQSLWLDPSRMDTLFQDSAGTVPGANKFRVARVNDRSGKGNNATQSAEANAPFLVDDAVLWFDSGDSLSVTFAGSLGANCTVVNAVPGTGVDVQTGVTIGAGAYAVNADTAGFHVFDRALSANEIATITKFLEMKLAILEFVDFNFNDLPLDPRITFTRASAGTYFDADGVMQTAAINQPRIDHDRVTGALRGLLVEEQRTNVATYSSQFGNAAWTKARSSFVPNQAAAPDGSMTAGLLFDSTDSGSHALQRAYSKSGASLRYTFSYFAKPGSLRHSRILMAGLSFNDHSAGIVDLETGAVTNLGSSGNFSDAVISVTRVGDYFRVALTATTDTTTTIRTDIRVAIDSTGNGDLYVGTGAGSIYVWGAQLEVGSFPTSYIPTEGTAMTRAADSGAIAPSSLRWNNSAATLFAETGFLRRPTAGTNVLLRLVTAGGNRLFAYNNTANDSQLLIFDGAASTAANSGSAVNTLRKFAVGIGEGRIFGCGGNGTVSTAPYNGNFSSPTSVGIFTNGSWNGTVRRLRYYPRRLSNTELQELTA